MKVSIIGTGYVGIVQALILANFGHKVTCIDNNKEIIDKLKNGIPNIYEPDLEKYLKKALKSKSIEFTSDLSFGIRKSKFIFICIGTPETNNGSADLSAIKNLIKSLPKYISSKKYLIIKSTVPIGTCDKLYKVFEKSNMKEYVEEIISNPEFLREGKAIEDCLNPDRVIIGCKKKSSKTAMLNLYTSFVKEKKIVIMDQASSELSKYAANSMLATKISFINEIGQLSEKFGGDITTISHAIGLDARIGSQFLNAGLGFGGSCFPKDISSLIFQAERSGIDPMILKSVKKRNQSQKKYFLKKILDHFNYKKDLNLTIWGLSFKPDTDDIRESPAIYLVKSLMKFTSSIRCYDPIASYNFSKEFGSKKISFFDDKYKALAESDGLVICTDWKEFEDIDEKKMKKHMNQYVIFDGRNIYSKNFFSAKGFKYLSIGR